MLLLSCSGFPPSSISHYRGDDTKARLIPSPLRRFMASRGAAATMTQGRPAMKSCGQRMNQEVSQSPELRHRKTSGGGRDTKENTTPHFCNKSSDHCIQDLSTQIKKPEEGTSRLEVHFNQNFQSNFSFGMIMGVYSIQVTVLGSTV